MDTYAQTIRLKRRLELTHPSLTGLLFPSPPCSSYKRLNHLTVLTNGSRVKADRRKLLYPLPPPFHTHRASARSSVNLEGATSWSPWHRQVGCSWCSSLTTATFKLCKTQLNPFISHWGSRKVQSLPYQALCVFAFTLDSSITSYWVGKDFRAEEAGKSFLGTWCWDLPRPFCKAWMGRVSPNSWPQAEATGYHGMTWHPNGFAFQLRKFFIMCSLKAQEKPSVCVHTYTKTQRGWVGWGDPGLGLFVYANFK